MSTRAGDRPFPLPTEVHPFVQTLVDDVLKGNIEALDAAVDNAKLAEFDDYERWGIVDGHSFLLYASGMLRWVPAEDTRGKALYDIMCMFHYVLLQSPVVELQNPIHPDQAGKPLLPGSKWVVDYSNEMAKFLETEESLTYEPDGGSFGTYARALNYNIGQADFSAGMPKTFNQFFSRKLKPGMRPQYMADDDRAITWPADSTFDNGLWDVTSASEVIIKGLTWKISDLLYQSEFGDKFAGGKWMHAFLNPADYHRQHAPVGGKVVEAKIIQGLQYVQIETKKDPVTGKKTLITDRRWAGATETRAMKSSKINGDIVPLVRHDLYELEAPNEPGYQFLQLRGSFVIESPTVGLVAVLPIGMGLISSVVPMVKTGDTVKKGDEISYFQFGGSDIVVVFQKDTNANLDHLWSGQHYCVGQLLASASPR